MDEHIRRDAAEWWGWCKSTACSWEHTLRLETLRLVWADLWDSITTYVYDRFIHGPRLRSVVRWHVKLEDQQPMPGRRTVNWTLSAGERNEQLTRSRQLASLLKDELIASTSPEPKRVVAARTTSGSFSLYSNRAGTQSLSTSQQINSCNRSPLPTFFLSSSQYDNIVAVTTAPSQTRKSHQDKKKISRWRDETKSRPGLYQRQTSRENEWYACDEQATHPGSHAAFAWERLQLTPTA